MGTQQYTNLFGQVVSVLATAVDNAAVVTYFIVGIPALQDAPSTRVMSHCAELPGATGDCRNLLENRMTDLLVLMLRGLSSAHV